MKSVWRENEEKKEDCVSAELCESEKKPIITKLGFGRNIIYSTLVKKNQLWKINVWN